MSRTLNFSSVDDVLAEVERLVAADRAGALRTAGSWTLGQSFGHLANWIEYGYEGFPFKVPWIMRIVLRMFLRGILRKKMKPGARIPGASAGTYGVEPMSTDEGARRFRAALDRLKRGEPARFDSPAFGKMSEADRLLLNLRHAELHLGFFSTAA